MNQKIGIICASDTELEPFIRQMKEVTCIEKAMLKFYDGVIQGMNVVVVYSGVGKVNAAIATQLLIDSFQVELMINAGVAGGMEEAIDLFDTVISEQSVYHDVTEDILTEFHPWLQENSLLKIINEKKLIRSLSHYLSIWRPRALLIHVM